MKKNAFLSVFVLLAVLLGSTVYGQGFTGPSAAGIGNSGQVQTVNVGQARNLFDKSLVRITGNIVQSVGRDKYIFRDSTGDITIKIDWKLMTLSGLSISPNDRVEIGGEIDVKRQGVELKVKTIRKI